MNGIIYGVLGVGGLLALDKIINDLKTDDKQADFLNKSLLIGGAILAIYLYGKVK